ncbi:MAG: hemerythrin domain-containing protein [Nanoarchaeota archaeon]|nr:hemerythrin domain-containing protein [DPANN group archaeon]MBL7117151.1 hemerythrin domain-containing protein [Nanoarchaeota archaeon]
MDEPTRILSDEHKNILKVIDSLLRECDALESGKDMDKRFFRKIVDFVRNYADRFHHAKEEDILFVELCKDNVQMPCNPTHQMLHEHDLGRSFVKNVEDGLKEDNKEKVVENARGYAQLLQEHIYKEDNILYPMADEALNQEIQKSMLDKFRQVEQRFGQKKEQYLSIVKELEKRK